MLRLLAIVIFILGTIHATAQTVAPDIPLILERNRGVLGLSNQDLAEYKISDVYTSAQLGVTHVYLEQRYQDIRVYNGILNLNLKDDKLLSFGNRWVAQLESKTPSPVPEISAMSAVGRSAIHLGKQPVNVLEIRREQNSLGQDTKVFFTPGELSESEIIAELFWLQGNANDVLLCWNIEIAETEAENVWHVFINAHSGEFVRKDNLVKHCAFDPHATYPHRIRAEQTIQSQSPSPVAPDSSYNVFAMPVESPNHGTRSIVERPWTHAGNGNHATTLGWHDTGTTNYTVTRGNNVHAYEDTDANNIAGFSPNSANLSFDYPFDPSLDPEDNMSAAITNLFYWNNIIHDVMYQYGFDEVSGNFQVNNLGRGGAGGDDVRAEGLDGGGLNNANFFTPSDGNRPRMQMYLWSPVSETSPLTINGPDVIAGSMHAVESDFSSANKLEDIGHVSGDLVLVEDTGGDTHQACGTLSNGGSLPGKIAVIDRGNCDFVVKVKTVQNLGAVAAIVINNVPGSPFAMGGTDNTIVIPAVMINLNDGNMLKAVMDTSVVNVSLDSVGTIIPDGDYDNGIIVHEYGHGISIRLTGGPSNVSCLNNDEQMGEGWSDYFGLMLTTDWNTATASDLRGIGTYVNGESTEGTGIRSYPYTTDTNQNPFTYADIADAPVTSGNPSVHFIGSVWCTMLWDMTWNIIEIEGVDTDMYHGTGGNNIALQLVIDALKLQPCSPGFVDGRDAILLADELRYGGAHRCAIWNAFASRGLGVNAEQGNTNDHDDGVESFDVPDGVIIASSAEASMAQEGQEVMFSVKAICDCEGKSDLEIADVLSEDLIYIPGSGGTLNGNSVEFMADTLPPRDSLMFTYRAYVRPCSASGTEILSTDNAEGPDQYESIKLAGTGNKNWVKSTAQAVSPTHSWYAEDYDKLANIALTLMDPVSVSGIIEIDFDHRYETEANYDGGVVEYSLNNGASWTDAGPYFIENGYPATINTTNTNSAIAGQQAFTGDSDDQFDTMGFIHSRIRLVFGSTQSLLVRFRFVCDAGVAGTGINGWYVDNITIHELSSVVNLTRVKSDGIPVDSMYYGLQTTIFEGYRLYVDQNAAGDQSGASWPDAIHHLPLALELAGCRDADSVLIAEGIYLPNLTNDREISFSISDSTSVFGGFPAGGGDFASRDPKSFVTILSGDIGVEDDASDNVYHVLKIDSAEQNILADGVTINHGNANGIGDNSRGAAVFCEGAVTLRDCSISNNIGLSDGQLILVRTGDGHLALQDCTVSGPAGVLAQLLIAGSSHLTVLGNTVFLKE